MGVLDYGPSSTPKLVYGVHSTSIFEFSVETHNLEVIPKLRNSTTEIGKIPAGETGQYGEYMGMMKYAFSMQGRGGQ
jgi:hypothetical protein